MDKLLLNKTVDAVVDEYIRPSKNMTLAAANRLISKVLEKAKEMNVKAVVAITDRGANPISIQRSDGAYIASYDIALNKAYTSVALKMRTKELAELAKPGGSLYGIQFTNGGKIVIFGGGEPLKSKSGEIVGGLGVSGGSEKEDTYLAEYGRNIFEKGLKQNGY